MRRKMNKENYTVEWCPYCEQEVVIYAHVITECPECGEKLFPCSVCTQECCNCPYEMGEQKALRITEEEIEKYSSLE